MDANRFDALSRALTTAASRRAIVGALLGTLLGRALPGSFPEALAAAGKTSAKKTGQGRGGRKHDRLPGQGAGAKDRDKHSRQDRHEASAQDVTDEQHTAPTNGLTPEPADEMVVTERGDRHAAAQPERSEVSTEEVSAATCLPPGAKPC